jgi:DNA-binding CsgD family transcriptional regulator
MAIEIVGREEELAAVRAFIGEDADESPAALVLEGEAGIGKSTLWLAAVEQARESGSRVLASRPAEAEQALAYAALGDLLEDVLEEVLPGLAPPRRRALEVALLREDDEDERVDVRALAVAVRDVLRSLAGNDALLVAVDDVQWLDASSSGALTFALRRFSGGNLRVLFARRLADGIEPSEPERVLETSALPVGPLSVGALHRFLRDRLGRTFARQTLLRIHERTGGNPFFALELARALPDEVDPLRPLPVPGTLDQLVRTRLAGLPECTRDALALASASGTPSDSLLARAGVSALDLDPAVAAHVIERENGTVRFTHPLLASGVYEELGDDRLRAHARLADVTDDPILRARHRALATGSPDADVAAAIEAAAKAATERGAPAAAAELAEHALRLTPADARDDRHRRALTAARAHLAAGEWTRARTIAGELLAQTDGGRMRAETLCLLAEFEHDDLAVPVLEEALREAAGHPALQARIRFELAWSRRFRTGFAAALTEIRSAFELAGAFDDALRLDALSSMVTLGGMVGDPQRAAYASRAHELAVEVGDPAFLREANVLVALTLVESDPAVARALVEHELLEWEERDELLGAELHGSLAWIELAGGRWESAADHAARAREVNLQYGVERNQDYIPSSFIALHRGQLELALADAGRGLELCDSQIGFNPPLLQAVPGLVALWRGDAATAVETLREADRVAGMLGWGSPDARRWTADYVEALLEVGRIDEARSVLDAWEADAVRLDRTRVLASVTRCRGLVAAAEGDVAGAVTLLERAVSEHEAVGDRFGRGRALLALGVARRRARQKRPARDAIAEALAGFEELGATTWIATARSELGSIGGRRREDGLTAAEQRVAALVAEGRTNREVAAALFLGERTVAGHLTRVYAKLGVRSRAELARRLS